MSNLNIECVKNKENTNTFVSACVKRWKFVKELITIEPLVACNVISGALCGPAINQLELEVSCKMDSGFNDTVCNAILSSAHDSYRHQNHIVQSHILGMQAWSESLQSLIPSFYLLTFLGSYSDRYKVRKPFLLMPVIGELFGVIGCMLNTYYMHEWSISILGFLKTIIPSLFGGTNVLVMAMFTYISDVSSIETRTLRVGLLQAIQNFVQPVVQTFAGALFKHYGYYGTFTSAIVVLSIGILYCYFFIEESSDFVPMSQRDSILSDIFTTKNIVEMFSIFTAKKINRNFIIVMLLVVITLGIEYGEDSIWFLYTQEVLHWTTFDFTHLLAFSGIVRLVGTIIFIPLLVKVLGLRDETILIIALIDNIIAHFIFAFSKTSFLIYSGVFINIMYAVACAVISSLGTKVAESDDNGKAQSIFAVCEALGAAIALPFYNKLIYENTISAYPNAFYLVSIGLLIICTSSIFCMSKTNDGKNKPKEKSDEEMELNKKSVIEEQI